MKRVLSALVLLPLFSLSVRAEDPVHFAEPTLKVVVEAGLWIAEPTPADMLALTELVFIDDGITDPTGVGCALNRQKLRLNTFGNISLLSGLAHLEQLILHRNQISDVSSLSGLTLLEYPDVGENPLNEETHDIHIPNIADNSPDAWIRYNPGIGHGLRTLSTAGGDRRDRQVPVQLVRSQQRLV